MFVGVEEDVEEEVVEAVWLEEAAVVATPVEVEAGVAEVEDKDKTYVHKVKSRLLNKTNNRTVGVSDAVD